MLHPAHLFHFSDHLFLALLALLANILLGGPRSFYERLHLTRIGEALPWLIQTLESKLNRTSKRSELERRWRGIILLLFMIVLALLAALWLLSLIHALNFGYLLEIGILAILLPIRPEFERSYAVLTELENRDLEAARKAVSLTARRSIGQMGEHGIVRAGIEGLAEHFADRLLSPLLWYLFFGLGGLLVCATISTADSMIGHRSSRYEAFGAAAARMDDAMHFIPARIAGCWLLVAACFVPRATPWRGFITMLRDARKLISPNSGWPIAATAGALGLSLAGPHAFHLAYVENRWVGSGTVKASTTDLKRALYLYSIACLLVIFTLAGAYYGIAR